MEANMKKLLLAIFVVLLLVSCSSEPTIVSFDISCTSPKSITATVVVPSAEELYWSCEIIGEESVEFEKMWDTKGLSDKSIKFRSGMYTIRLKAYDDRGDIVLTGTTPVVLKSGRNIINIKMETTHGGTVTFKVSGRVDGDISDPVVMLVERGGMNDMFSVYGSQMSDDGNGDLKFMNLTRTIPSSEEVFRWDIVVLSGGVEKMRVPFNIMMYEHFVTEINVDVRSTGITFNVQMPSNDILELL